MKRRYLIDLVNYLKGSGRDFEETEDSLNVRKRNIRLDELLIQKGIANDKKSAQAVIIAGNIKVNRETIRRPDVYVDINSCIEVYKKRYVSRGGEKLEGALIDFHLDVKGLICADIGISTGGFTDCLLKHGASRIYGFDVGYGITDYSLRKDRRLILFERCNFKKFDTSTIEEMVDLIVMDLSFISIKKIIPNASKMLLSGGRMLILVKPQFEALRENVSVGGIVRDPEIIKNVLGDICEFLESSGFNIIGVSPSRIKGAKGNQEYFVLSMKK